MPQTQQLVVEAGADDGLCCATTGLNVASVVHTPVLFESGYDIERPHATVAVPTKRYNATSGVHTAR